jgi:hypothetical protein
MRTSKVHAIVVLVLFSLASLACGDYGSGSSASGTVVAGSLGTGLPEGLSVAEQVTSFETTVYPVLRTNCASCHSGSGPGSPRIADPSVATAWSAVVDNQKVNFSNPAASRLVRRLASDFHHCWSDCGADAGEMLAQILAWQSAIESSGGSTAGIDVAELTSEVRQVSDGFEEEGFERFDEGIIARWDFKEEVGTIAFDTSGVEPAMNLSLEEGTELLSAHGIRVTGGRAIATAEASRKLFDRIASPETGSQAYSVEAWIANANITQDGPARIISYSRNRNNRNFMLGQDAYQYILRNRAFLDRSNNDGGPDMATYAEDEDAQATLQHVVMTYDQLHGRRIFVDGRWTDDVDELPPGRLWNWDPSYRLVLGNEITNDRPWLGQIRFVAIYDRSLPIEAIRRNFEAGVGKRVTLAFDVSEWTGGSSQVEFSLTQLDDYSYLFCAPTFVTNVGSPIRVQNIRISINDIFPVSGQSFTQMNALVTSGRQLLSRQCSVIGGVADPATDTFQLAFEQLGVFQDPVVSAQLPPPGAEDFGDPVPVLGVRSFGRVNASMAAVTGVDPLDNEVVATFEGLVQQLPSSTDMRSFVPANQVGIAKLGIEYCDALVGTSDPATQGRRDAFFTGAAGFGWDQPPSVAFAAAGDVDLITDPLLDKVVGAGLRGDVGGLPARDQVEAILDQLVVDLSATCGGAGAPPCDGDFTKNIVKGLCAAVVSSGPITIH